MRHLGDITKISGYEAPVVDVIIGGSPCQDLSVANGKRKGLAGERSGLYMEQIRIIKEMRDKDARHGRSGNLVRPRYMVWENVPGAFSSNGGKDFAAVIEEAIRVAEPEAPSVPVPQKGWPTSGVYADEQGRWSVAWRVLDAQFWGVPQRRRRIALVADFGGLSAPEVLFVRNGVFGNHPQSECERQEAAGDAGASSAGAGAVGLDIYNFAVTGDVAASLTTATGLGASNTEPSTMIPVTLETGIAAREGDGLIAVATQQGGAEISENGICPTITAAAGMSGNNQPWICSLEHSIAAREGVSGALRANALNTTDRHAVAYGIGSYHSNAWKSDNPHSGVYEADTAKTLDALNCGYPACNQGGMAIVESVGFDAYQHHGYRENDKCGTLTAGQNDGVRGDTPLIVEPYTAGSYGQYIEGVGTLRASGGDYGGGSETLVACGVDCRNATEYVEFSGTLQSDASHNNNSNNVVRVNHIVRRLTPLECERLQGFPDGWTDIGEWVDSKGKKHKDADSPRYKALGNSIAIPPWKWVCKRLCACYERDATMASLFDGIGGFPLIWEQLNGKGSCLWASEIEEFPIAVTKLRFGGE